MLKLTHYIRLSPDCHESIDMLADRHKHFARHMAAFLGPRRLIFDVDTCRSLFDKQLRKLHNCCETAMSGVSICYYWA